jgi:sulfite exporter TauE/SafE
LDVFLSGLLLGLSTGIFCLGYCAPVLVPFLMSERRTATGPLVVIAQVSAGRFIAYLAVGALAGYLGSQIQGELFQKASALALIAMGALLGLFLIRRAPLRLEALCRWGQSLGPRYPFLFGILAGLNLCPPFLAAIALGASTSDVVRSALVFVGFFMGTTVFFIALIPAGWAGRWEPARMVGRMAGALSAVFLVATGAVQLIAG